MDIAAQLALGFCLAAATGLRAFLPLLAVSIGAHAGLIHLNASFAWIGTTPAIAVLGTAAVLEVLADKIPLVHHLLDVLQTFVRPAAGFVAVACTEQHLSPVAAGVVGLILGAPVAGGVHIAKSTARVAASVTTAGLASPFLSLLEDLASLVTVLVAAVAPFAAAGLVVLGLIYLIDRVRTYRLSRPATQNAQPAAK